MHLPLLLLCVLLSSRAEDLKDLSFVDILRLGQDVSQLVPDQIQDDAVQFYLVTKDSRREPMLIEPSNNLDCINSTKATKVLIHGWIENHKRSWYQRISDEYLNKGDFNIVLVDWAPVARMTYIYSAEGTKFVGFRVAALLLSCNLTAQNVHLIGHSLGAHAAGFAAKKIFTETGLKVGRISGLDPAGPFYRQFIGIPQERLDKSDALVVDILHTDAGYYGYEFPLGTLDIYVNGGHRVQPGCLNEWTVPTSLGDAVEKSFCSHARSTKYFSDWINNGKFQCKFCKSPTELHDIENCAFQTKSRPLAADDVTQAVTGICLATTNQQEPFLD